MPDVTWIHPFIDKVLNLIPVDSRYILDVGCGRGLIGAICKIYRQPEAIVGIDVFDDYLRFCKEHMPYSMLIKHDLREGLPTLNLTFDAGVCLEVLEHLEKSQGERLIAQMEKICKRVIVSTPPTFFSQEAYDGNQHQAHVSLWSDKDFRAMGFVTLRKVRGIWICGRSIKFVSSVLSRFLSEARKEEEWIIAYKDCIPGNPR